MIKGDKIKLIAKMGAYSVGEICKVVNVDENGVISFSLGKKGMHLGCMSYNEFEKYFELVSENKREWSDWIAYQMYYYTFGGNRIAIIIYCRHNGKKIQVKYNCGEGIFIRAESSCHSEDKFDFEKGLKLAKCRLIVKLLQKEIKDYAKAM